MTGSTGRIAPHGGAWRGLVFVALLSLHSSAVIAAGSVEAGDRQAVLRPVALTVLSASDAYLYSRIFTLQDSANWKAADKLIRKLDDRLLMGHVLYQRYMHPTGYRSRYSELAPWLKKYRDHPGARRLYNLARSRKPARARGPLRPLRAWLPGQIARPVAQDAAKAKKVTRRIARARRGLRARITRYLRRGDPDRAEHRLWASRRAATFDDPGFDRQLARVAASYFFKGRDKKAEALAVLALRSDSRVPQAAWIAGLAAWRQGTYGIAAARFARLAGYDGISPWLKSAGAVWAGRAYLKTGQMEKVNDMLAIGAGYPRTFYGMIAARQLGQDMTFSWGLPVVDEETMGAVSPLPAVQRAIGLVQAGRSHWADRELKLAAQRAALALRPALLSLAMRLNLPATQLTLSDQARARGKSYEAALYPVPDWQPDGGFSVDRAIMFAIIRQESRFNAAAKSAVGARGLMQLMPRTASLIARDRSLRYANRTRLYAPDFNMALGQKYLHYLLGLNQTRRNLFLIATAYNSGPGNMIRWLKRTRYNGDWLLFIESIPVSETRDFIEKVLSNLWIYRTRLGQATPTLDQVAAGGWPLYQPLDRLGIDAAAAVGPAVVSDGGD